MFFDILGSEGLELELKLIFDQRSQQHLFVPFILP